MRSIYHAHGEGTQKVRIQFGGRGGQRLRYGARVRSEAAPPFPPRQYYERGGRRAYARRRLNTPEVVHGVDSGGTPALSYSPAILSQAPCPPMATSSNTRETAPPARPGGCNNSAAVGMVVSPASRVRGEVAEVC